MRSILQTLPTLIVVFSLSSLLASPARGRDLILCERQGDCPRGRFCQHGVCQHVPALGDEGALFGLAVPALRAPGGRTDYLLASRATQRLRRVLSMQGPFRIITGRAAGKRPLEPEAPTPAGIDEEGWHRAGAWTLLLGAIWSTRSDEVVLEVRLLEVESGRSVPLASARQSFPREALPEAIERIAAELLRLYTGRPGIFGSRIAFTRKVDGHKEIFSVDPTGDEEQRHTRDGSINLLPSWSPSGDIAYTSYRDGNPDLWVGNRKLSARQDLNTGAAFSPDGQTVALTLSLEGNPDVFLIDARSGDIIKRLTKHAAIDTSPTWSPDGERIAFVSDRAGTPQIYVMSLASERIRAVTHEGYNTNPNWSPTRDIIAFDRLTTAERSDIYIVELGSGTIRRLTRERWTSEDPYFSPDGRQLVFKSTRDGTEQLYVMSADGEHLRRLTHGSGPYGSPSWSPSFEGMAAPRGAGAKSVPKR